ncbi:ComF family protein [Desulfallas thermosapovorans]|uniref:ComF family protein n=1 Tax=Desulfallas thermosapovorans DSM 6562 TaxID=1121431 RepID=A0A5S4ZPR0_9FIRM|nr:ComF family protein [Desulfallas thermosapovorans]TYO94810.1 ComF family protein [Desulfallas thermosapovorans DSM 6562]
MLQAVIELIYPSRLQCPLCGAHSPEEALCHNCRQLLAGYAVEAICGCCGCFTGVRGDPEITARGPDRRGWMEEDALSPGLPAGEGNLICPACRAEPRPFDLARAVAPYEGPVREAVHRLKYRGMQQLARPLGELMASVALREEAFARTGVILPVPLHQHRRRQRGYNQSALLARAVGDLLQVPVSEQVLVKTKETPSQTSLTGPQRRLNLQDAFAVADSGPVKGKIVTVIDDVFTTGSTVSILSHLLRQSGAAGVLVLTLAGTRQTGKK